MKIDDKYCWMLTYWHTRLSSGVGVCIASNELDDLLKSAEVVVADTLLSVGSTAIDIFSMVFPPALAVGAIVKLGLKAVR